MSRSLNNLSCTQQVAKNMSERRFLSQKLKKKTRMLISIVSHLFMNNINGIIDYMSFTNHFGDKKNCSECPETHFGFGFLKSDNIFFSK